MKSKLGVVIGGGNGIGEACCRLMSQRDWKVVVVDLDGEAAKAVAGSIGGHAYAADITDLAAIKQLELDIDRAHGPVEALVIAAAAFQEKYPAEEFPMDLWDKIMKVNLEASFNACRVFGGRMAKAGKGSIVTIASIGGHASSPNFAYGPAKAALLNLTQSLAAYWGKSGVRVNSVSPGSTLVTRVLNRKPGRYAADMDSHMALGRRVQPAEVAEGVEFLLSDRASAITGTDLLVDCGWMAASPWGIYGGTPGPVTQSVSSTT